jgi:hypothetical protein
LELHEWQHSLSTAQIARRKSPLKKAAELNVQDMTMTPVSRGQRKSLSGNVRDAVRC